MSSKLSFKRDRPTIGILAGWSAFEETTPDYYGTPIIRGIQSAAHSRGCHVLLSGGNRRDVWGNQFFTAWPVVSASSDFIPVGPWNTDGLIVFTPLHDEPRSLYLQQLMAEGFPVLFVATGEPGPTIAVKNSLGIQQAVSHLVEHGHRRIAFIAGLPNDKGDSASRLQAYYAAVEQFGLETDPRLVVWGKHDFFQGYLATQGLLNAQVEFTAVVASNDNSATGAMRAIQKSGLNIPDNVAIIGFDDHPGAVAQVPPLSSIHVPLGLIGQQALLLMHDHLTKHTPLESVYIPTRLVKRRSCGCVSDVVSASVEGTAPETFVSVGRKAKLSSQDARKHLVSEMLDTLPAELRYPAGKRIRQTCILVVDAFYQSLEQEDPLHFQTMLIKVIQELETSDASVDYWQEMISALRRKMALLPVTWRHKNRYLAESMLHQARAILGESMQRQDQRHRYQRDIVARALSALTARLSAALNEEQMTEILNEHLPALGIRHARVLFFEAEGDDSVAWSVLLADGSKPQRQRFLSRQFPPPELYSSDELLNLILLPLHFQNEILGYVAFDAGDLGACAVIAKQLAATIKVSRLHNQVVELSLTDALTNLYNRRYLDLFLKNEIARSQRFSRGLSVILADIDHFKSYNDAFGHPAGDVAIQRVASALIHERRSADVVARIGGEEFALILPETDLYGAMRVAEKVRIAIATVSDLKRPITVSLGVTTLCDDSEDSKTLLQRADLALYQAKNTGRNRVCVNREKCADAQD